MLFVHKTTYLTCASTIANLFWSDSIHSPNIRQPLSPDSIHSPDIRQPLSPDSIHSLTFPKGHFWEKCDSPRHIRTSNSSFWRIWGEWPLLTYYIKILIAFLLIIFLNFAIFDSGKILTMKICNYVEFERKNYLLRYFNANLKMICPKIILFFQKFLAFLSCWPAF